MGHPLRRFGAVGDRPRRQEGVLTGVSYELRHDLDMSDPDAVALLAKNIFVFGQCMQGTQFYGLFGMILSL